MSRITPHRGKTQHFLGTISELAMVDHLVGNLVGEHRVEKLL